MTIEGKCSGRRVRVSVEGDAVVVTLLDGDQAGSVFTHGLAELKRKPDIVVDRGTKLYSAGVLGAILFGCLALLTVGHWGEGIATQAFWVSLGMVCASIVVVRLAPKKKTYLWSTKSGVQAFGLEESPKNREALQSFISSIEAAVGASK